MAEAQKIIFRKFCPISLSYCDLLVDDILLVTGTLISSREVKYLNTVLSAELIFWPN